MFQSLQKKDNRSGLPVSDEASIYELFAELLKQQNKLDERPQKPASELDDDILEGLFDDSGGEDT